jgi:hypothetical protein
MRVPPPWVSVAASTIAISATTLVVWVGRVLAAMLVGAVAGALAIPVALAAFLGGPYVGALLAGRLVRRVSPLTAMLAVPTGALWAIVIAGAAHVPLVAGDAFSPAALLVLGAGTVVGAALATTRSSIENGQKPGGPTRD